MAELVAAALVKEPRPKALIVAKARSAGIPTRRGDDLLLLAKESGAIHQWPRNSHAK